MKNRVGTGVFFIIAGLLTAIGPLTVFKVCEPGETIMKCWWSARAEIGVGVLLVAIGLVLMLCRSREARIAVSIVAAAASAVEVMIPGLLIGGCMKKEMACQSVAFPVLYVIGILCILVSVINSIYLTRKEK